MSGADRARVAAATCLVLGAGCWHDTEPLASLPEREVELVFTVGTGTSDTSIVFGMVNDAEILADASIVVIDAMSPAIQWFDSSGVWQGRIGRDGSGPGEYRTPTDVAALDDGRVVVWDPGNARLNLYGGDGLPLETVAMPTNTVSATRALFVDRRGRAYIRIQPHGATPGEFGLLQFELATGAVDTVRLFPDHAPAPLVGDPRFEVILPFAPTPTWSVLPDGGFIASERTEYVVRMTDDAGNEVATIRQPYTPAAVEPEEAAAFRDAITSVMRRREAGWRWRGPDIPSVKPAIRSVSVTSDGRILVRPHVQAVRAPGDPAPNRLNWVEPQIYHLYEVDGTPVGAFRLPDSTVLLRVRGNRVVARRERANGEIVVDVYRLQDPVLRSDAR